MKEPTVTVEHTLYQVVVKPGEVLTVYLEVGDGFVGTFRQIELRVTPDGRRQIFIRDLDVGDVEIMPFTEWYGIP